MVSRAHQREDPRMSVVVAAWSGEALLAACLRSLLPQCTSVEVVVAVRGVPPMLARLERRFPGVRFVPCPAGADVFELRAIGVAHATGSFVALIEDHVTVDPTWVEALWAAGRDGRGIVGGPVANGLVRSPSDWATYFAEYGLHMPPVTSGATTLLSGVNIAYDRALLDGCRELWKDAFRENEVNDALRARGHHLHLVSGATVVAHLPLTLTQAAAHLYEGGRHFGAYRAGSVTWPHRVVLAASSPLIPVVLSLRLVRRILSRRPSHGRHLLRCAAHFAVVTGAWAAGEAVGHLRSLIRTRPQTPAAVGRPHVTQQAGD